MHETNETREKARAYMEQLFQWGEPSLKPTVNGEKRVRTAKVPADHPFWRTIYQDPRRQRVLTSLGIVVSNAAKGHELMWWSDLTEQEIRDREQAEQMSRATEANIDVPAPAGKEYRPYQLAGIQFILNRDGTLLADEMGIGKTIQAIGTVNARADRIHRALFMCPAGLTINWERELRAWLLKRYSIARADGACFPSTDIVICPYSIAHKWTKQLNYFWDLAVLDEVHFLKNPQARRTKAILGGSDDPERGITSSGIPARMRIALTGTPIENRPVELYTVLRWLDPEAWRDQWHYYRRYCNAKRVMRTIWKTTDGRRQKLQIPGWDFSGADNLEELQQRARATVMIRRLKREVMKELPPKMRQVLVIPADLGKRTVKAEQELALKIAADLAPLRAAVALAKAGDSLADYRSAVDRLREGGRVPFKDTAKVRHEVALAKLPAAMDDIEATLEATPKLIVFAHHLDVMDEVQNRFGKILTRMDGGMSTTEKQRSVDRFQQDPECRIILGNRTMYAGWTLTAASVVTFIELSWVPGDILQGEDRAHRHGQKETVHVRHLVADGSIEVNQARSLVQKMDIIDKALDRDYSAVEMDEPTFLATSNPELTYHELQAAAAGMTTERLKAIRDRIEQWTPANQFEQELAKALAGKKILTAREAALLESIATGQRGTK